MTFEFHMPETLLFGGASRHRAGEVAARLGMRKVLLVSDRFLTGLPVYREVLDSLRDKGMEVFGFSEMEAEPSDQVVRLAVEALKEHQCDGAVSLGGGSCIDTAKAACVWLVNGGELSDFQGYHKVVHSGLPHIAIPTTAGTGSEATRITVINDLRRNVKMMCLDNAFLPDAAIIDYETTLSMPAALTAYVGLDALTHAIEAYVSRKANPLSDSFALSAIRLISGSIMTAFHRPGDLAAREAMMQAATYAGIAFSNASVCAVHGLSRPIGALFHVPHGLSNAFLLPVVTAHSMEGNISRYAQIARSMGLGDIGMSDDQLATAAVDLLKALNKNLKIPSMEAWGIEATSYANSLKQMVQDAIDSGSPANNPRIFTPEELAEIYREAYMDA